MDYIIVSFIIIFVIGFNLKGSQFNRTITYNTAGTIKAVRFKSKVISANLVKRLVKPKIDNNELRPDTRKNKVKHNTGQLNLFN